MTKEVMIIAGMHRSGTSFFANFLSNAGLNIGQNLLFERDNPKGHFEDVDFLAFHQKILQDRQLDNAGLSLQESPKGFSESEKIEGNKLVLAKNAINEGIWGWKEPRTTLFLEDWFNIADNCYVVAVFRHFSEVVDSLIRRDYLMNTYPSRNFVKRTFWKLKYSRINRPLYLNFLKQWIIYNEKLLDFQNNHPDRFMLFDISSIYEKPDLCISKINESVGISLNSKVENIFEKRYMKIDSKVWYKRNSLSSLAEQIYSRLKESKAL